MTGGHNKTGKVDDSATKFAANIRYIIGNLCSKFGDNWFMFKELQQKDRWTQVRGPEHSRRQSLI